MKSTTPLIVAAQDVREYLGSGLPTNLQYGGLVLLTKGEADVIINAAQYKTKAGDLVCCFPRSVVQTINISDDIDGICLAVGPDFFTTIQINDKANYYITVAANPCISLSEAEQKRLLKLYREITSDDISVEHPYYEEIMTCLVRIVAYEAASFYRDRKPTKREASTRNQEIFRQFIYHLFSEYREHRDLAYYASVMCLTPRHLSAVVKDVSGYTAYDHIENCVALNIKAALGDDSKTISEIAYEFNFPNPSFFSQFFKKNTGMTPREYRNTLSER